MQATKRLLVVVAMLVMGIATASRFALGQANDDLYSLEREVSALIAAGKVADAMPLAERQVAAEEGRHGAEHPSVGLALLTLAEVHGALSQYAEAERDVARARAIFDRWLDPADTGFIRLTRILASIYQATGRPNEANLARKEAAALEQSLVAGSQVYELWRASRFADALPIAERRAALAEQQLGKDHPAATLALFDVAAQYQGLNRFGEAEEIYRRAIAALEARFGRAHPSVVGAMGNLGILLMNQTRYAEAAAIFRDAMESAEQGLKWDAGKLAYIQQYLASAYGALGRHADAEPLWRRSLVAYEKNIQPYDPTIRNSLKALAGALTAQGRVSDAEPLLVRSAALDAIASILDQSLAETEPKKSLALAQRAVALAEQRFGPDHLANALPLKVLARSHQAAGQFAEAERHFQRGQKLFEDVLGPTTTLWPACSRLAPSCCRSRADTRKPSRC